MLPVPTVSKLSSGQTLDETDRNGPAQHKQCKYNAIEPVIIPINPFRTSKNLILISFNSVLFLLLIQNVHNLLLVLKFYLVFLINLLEEDVTKNKRENNRNQPRYHRSPHKHTRTSHILPRNDSRNENSLNCYLR